MQCIGNTWLNGYLEATLDGHIKPAPSSPMEAKSAYIKRKYIDLAYAHTSISFLQGQSAISLVNQPRVPRSFSHFPFDFTHRS
jgi:hypothetical protein